MALILIVEDDREIAEMLELYLRHDGHRTERAADGESALTLFRAARPDLVFLDVGLPKLDGLEVLRRVRAVGRTPVVMLTARSKEIDELLGSGLGADSYLTKPCSPRKVLAHVQAVVRVGPLEVDTYRVEARVGGSPLRLTPTEFRLLESLARAPGKAMSRPELLGPRCPRATPWSGLSTGTLKTCAPSSPRRGPPTCWRPCAASATGSPRANSGP